jgi:hypothetical protein
LIWDVVESVRDQLPNSFITIAADGVRKSVEHRREQYEEYINRLQADTAMPQVLCFRKPMQQAGMLRRVLECLGDEPDDIIFFVEHDCVISRLFVDWASISLALLRRELNFVRLYWRDEIHPEHEYLMRGEVKLYDATFMKTVQFSGWPFLATASYLREILEKWEDPGVPQMIESMLYGPCANSPWEEFKIGIYYPRPDATRFFHRDGRQGIGNAGADAKEW